MANFNKKALIYGDDVGHQQRQKTEFLRYAGDDGWTATIDDNGSFQIGLSDAEALINRAVTEGFEFVFYAFSGHEFYDHEWGWAVQNGIMPVIPHCDNDTDNDGDPFCDFFLSIPEWMALGGNNPNDSNLPRRSRGPHLELETYAGTSADNNLTTAESHTTAVTAGILAHILENGFDHSGMSKKEALLEARSRLRTKGDNYSSWNSGDYGFGYFDSESVASNWTTINDVDIQPPLGAFVQNIGSNGNLPDPNSDGKIQFNWLNYDVSKLSKTKIRDVKRDEIIYDGSGEFPRSDGSTSISNGDINNNTQPGFEVRNYYRDNEFELWHVDQSGNTSKKVKIDKSNPTAGGSFDINYKPEINVDIKDNNKVSTIDLGEFDQIDWDVYKDGAIVESFSGSFPNNEDLRFDSSQTSTYKFEVTGVDNDIGKSFTSQLEYTTFTLFSSRQYV